jgi:hypothetical protein
MAEETQDGSLLADPPAAGNWYSDEYAELVTQQGWKGAGDVLRDYNELNKSASGKVKLPTDESSAEEISAFYDKIGRPKTPNAQGENSYEIERPKMPEGMTYDEDFEKAMCSIAHEAGISKSAMQKLVKAYNEYQVEQYNTLTAELTKTYDEGQNALKSEWKDKYDTNLKVAQRACRELGGEDFVQLLETNKLGNNPVFIKTFHNIGLKILNDTLIQGTQGGGERKDDWKPAYPDSPEMYATDTSPEGEKARLWFTQRGHIY